MAANKKSQGNEQEAFHFIDSFWDSWRSGVNFVYDSQKEAENLTLQAFEQQKAAWDKVAANMNKIEEEQKNVLKELCQNVVQNIQNMSGEQSGTSFEKQNEYIGEVINKIQQLTLTPYKASLNVLSQSQQHFQESITSFIKQQQKNREELKPLVEDFLNQVKTTQKGFFEVLENNTKAAFNMFH